MTNELYDAFINLFENMGLVPAVFMVTGIIMITVELFHSSTRFAIGICGACLLVAGIITRILTGGTFAMFFILIFINTSLVFLAHILSLLLKKRNWIAHSHRLAQSGKEGIVRDGTFSYLINTVGLATTDINPFGNISADNAAFRVSADEPIEKGSLVCIVEADSDKILVRRVRKDEESEPEFLTRMGY